MLQSMGSQRVRRDQATEVKRSEVVVAVSCVTLCDPMDCSPRLLCPWDSPGMDTGVGCHFFLQGLPNPGIESRSPTLQADSLLSEPPTELIVYFEG